MYIQQLYTNCLAQAAYYIESEGEVMIIDPLRDIQVYLDLAGKRKAKIKYVFETHFHADFVSGHLELSRKTGAVIIYGPNAKPKFNALIAVDGETVYLGKIKLQVIHTPGHTIESSCLLLSDEMDRPHCLFSGDTLFAGDVGRPDLLSGNLSKETLAGMLFDSIQKLKKLPDELIVYPGHGAGSACGKNIEKENFTTIGIQKKRNYAMADISKAKFVELVLANIPAPPAYFFKDAVLNVSGYDSYEALLQRENRALEPKEVKLLIDKEYTILDTRTASEFAKGFIPGSINIGLTGDFAFWAGTILEFGTPIILVTEFGKEIESITRLARIGFDSVHGFLKGGFDEWKKAGYAAHAIEEVSIDDLKSLQYHIIDVRNNSERSQKFIEGSEHIPLSIFKDHIHKFTKHSKCALYCAGGYRSMIAASLLKKHGIHHLVNLSKGINAYSYSEIQKS